MPAHTRPTASAPTRFASSRFAHSRIARAVLLVAVLAGALAAAGSGLAAELTGFDGGDFRGTPMRFSAAVPDLRAAGFGKPIASLRVRSGKWLLCSEPQFQGQCFVTGQDVRALAPLGFADRVASLRPVAGAAPPGNGGWGPGARPAQGTIVLFTDPSYRGEALRLERSVTDLAGSGLNSRVGSFRVFGGVWQLCAGADGAGPCMTANTDAPDLSGAMDERIASVRRVQ